MTVILIAVALYLLAAGLLIRTVARDTGEITWRKVDTVSAFEDEARALAEAMG